jgi:hypothetical protein
MTLARAQFGRVHPIVTLSFPAGSGCWCGIDLSASTSPLVYSDQTSVEPFGIIE